MTKEAFWAKVGKCDANDCWPWLGYIGKEGYGKLWEKGTTVQAHRRAFEDHWGVTLPQWLYVCHDCPSGDNRACCNPSHLWLGTAHDNNKDAEAKGRRSKELEQARWKRYRYGQIGRKGGKRWLENLDIFNVAWWV